MPSKLIFCFLISKGFSSRIELLTFIISILDNKFFRGNKTENYEVSLGPRAVHRALKNEGLPWGYSIGLFSMGIEL